MKPRLLVLACIAALTVVQSASADDKAACLDAADKGQTLRNAHKLLEALDKFRACAAAGCPAVVQSDCTTWLAEVEKAVPTIVFEAKDAAGKDLSEVAVSVDGARLAASLTGAALPVDPGQHTFTFDVAGQAPIVQQFVINEGEKARRERILIGAAAPGPAAAPTPAPVPAKPIEASGGATASGGHAEPVPAAPPPDTRESAGAGDGQRTIGLVGVGLGAAGLAAGAVFGALSLVAHSAYEAHCGSSIGASPNVCDQTGVNGQADAANKGTMSTVFFVAGGVLAAGGAVLYFAAPRSGHVQVGAGTAGLVVRGTW